MILVGEELPQVACSMYIEDCIVQLRRFVSSCDVDQIDPSRPLAVRLLVVPVAFAFPPQRKFAKEALLWIAAIALSNEYFWNLNRKFYRMKKVWIRRFALEDLFPAVLARLGAGVSWDW